jgi:long-subunit fatty acid transport protein
MGRILGALLACLAGPAWAQDSFELLAVDAASAALGGAVTATSEGFASVYYDPANLAFCKDSSVGVRAGYLMHGLDVTVPEGDPAAKGTPNRLGLTAGGCLRLPHALALGVAIDMSGNLLGLDVSTPNAQPRWLMYGSALQRPTIQAALAWAPREDLALGIGISASVAAEIGLAAGLPVFEDGTVQVEIASKARAVAGVIAGVSYRPKRVKLGLTYRQAHYIHLQARTPIRLDEDDAVAIVDLSLASPYTPHQVALGVAVDPIPSLTLMADLTWYHWSGYTGREGGFGPYIQAVPGTSEDLPEEANAADLLEYADVALVFRDTFSPRVGVEYRWRERLAVRGGYHYRMSPYPMPSGETNLLDRDTHTGSVGVGYTLRVGAKGEAWEERRHRLTVDGYGRIGVLGTALVEEAGRGQYARVVYGGEVFDVGVALTYGWR